MSEPKKSSLSVKDAAGSGSISSNSGESFQEAKSPTQFDTVNPEATAGTANKEEDGVDKQLLEGAAQKMTDSYDNETGNEVKPAEDETLAALVSSYSISLRTIGFNKNHELVFHVISNCSKVVGYLEVMLGLEVSIFKNMKGDELYVGHGGLYRIREYMYVKDSNQSPVATVTRHVIDMGELMLVNVHPKIHEEKEKLVITFLDEDEKTLAEISANENTVFLEFEMSNYVVLDQLSRAMMVMHALKCCCSIYYLHQHPVPFQLLPQLSTYKPGETSLDIVSHLSNVVFRASCKDEFSNRYIDIFNGDSLQIALVLCLEGMTYWKFKDVFGATQFYLKSVNPHSESEKVSVYAQDGKILGSFERHMRKARFFDACGDRLWKGVSPYFSYYTPDVPRSINIYTVNREPRRKVAHLRPMSSAVNLQRYDSTVTSEHYALLMAYTAMLIRDHYKTHNQMLPTFASYPFLRP